VITVRWSKRTLMALSPSLIGWVRMSFFFARGMMKQIWYTSTYADPVPMVRGSGWKALERTVDADLSIGTVS